MSNDSEWANKAISNSCITESWGHLTRTLNEKIKNKLNQGGYSRFSELNHNEQAALVEREFYEMQHSDNSVLKQFNYTLNELIDEQLLQLIRLERTQDRDGHFSAQNKVPQKGLSTTFGFESNSNMIKQGIEIGGNVGKNSSNIDFLLDICSEQVLRILNKTPDAMSTIWALFLNRSIPMCLRAFMWFSSMKIFRRIYEDASETIHTVVNLNYNNKMTPSLDILFSRRCHVLLDMYFPTISCAMNAAIVKSLISTFMKRYDFDIESLLVVNNQKEISFNATAPTNGRENIEIEVGGEFEETDMIFFVIVPLMKVLTPELLHMKMEGEMSSGQVSGYNTSYSYVSSFDNLTVDIDSSVFGKYCNMISSSGENDMHVGKSKTPLNEIPNLSVSLAARVALESMVNMEYLGIVPSPGVFVLHSPYLERTMDLLQLKDSELAIKVNLFSHGDSDLHTSFRKFADAQLKRGLSGFLTLETTNFVWEQCFIAGFSTMLPLMFVSILLGCKNEFNDLVSLKSVIDTIKYYGRCIRVFDLQRLLTKHCSNELRNIYDQQGTFRIKDNEAEGIMQALWQEIVPDSDNLEVLPSPPPATKTTAIANT